MPEGIELHKNMVKQMRELFLAAHPTLPMEDDEEGEHTNRQKFMFDTNLKHDIGMFYCLGDKVLCKKSIFSRLKISINIKYQLAY